MNQHPATRDRSSLIIRCQLIATCFQAQIGLFPVEYAKNCAKAMVQAAREGERYLTVPAWFGAMYLWRLFAPEVVEACYRLLYMHGHGARQADAPSRTMAEAGGKQLLYPTSLRSDEIKK